MGAALEIVISEQKSDVNFVSLFITEPRTLLCCKLVLWKRNNGWLATTNQQQIYKGCFWTKLSFKC